MASELGQSQHKGGLYVGFKSMAENVWYAVSPSSFFRPKPPTPVVAFAPEGLAVSMETSAFPRASDHLWLPAKKAAAFIICLSIRETKSRSVQSLMQRIATRLWVLSVALEYLTHPVTGNTSIQKNAADTLLQLRKIFLRREPGNIDYKQIAGQIIGQIDDFERENLETRVIRFFESSHSAEAAKQLSDAETLYELCQELIRGITGGRDWTKELPIEVKPPEPNIYPNAANDELFKALQSYTLCACRSSGSEQDHAEQDLIKEACKWHPTRLPLGGPLKPFSDQEDYTTFEVVVSTFPDDIWTQFKIGIISRQVRFQTADTEDPLLERHFLCPNLGQLGQFNFIELKYAPGSGLMKSSVPQPVTGLYREQGMRLSSVVGNHTFSVRDKIILAHTVAQAFWQLYASELMRCLWTSDNVWFMREDNDGTPRDALPMKAYISFDFGDAPHTVPEFLESSPQDLTHRFPHVLALGILLLEIALGSKVRVSEFTDISHITSNHTKAHQKWRDLKETKWDGFSLHMSHLINAIGHCLDFKKVWQYSCPSKPSSKVPIMARKESGKSGTKLDQKKPTDLGARRDLLYEKVVKPLAWLAAAFHEDSENVTYPYKDITYLLPCPNEEKLRPAVNFEPKSSLFSPNRTNTHWLSEIKTINGYVREQLRARQGKLKEAESEKDHSLIKVAILDTGYNPDLDFFKREGRQNRIKWKDFVDTEQDAKSDLKSNAVDDHGHGSFMTKLVMDTAPLADIYAVRVAKDNDSIHHKNERIAEAIRWAGLDKEARVDVISMSFAFEAELEDVKEISAAIAAVRSGRDDKVIFLAAAGNFGVEQSDMFPAWHQDVIAIHAADSRGKFLETDPVPMKKSEPEFGTIGDDLPSYFTEEIAKFYPKLNTDGGSSIATAVAAGMIATTLIHADLLPYLPSRLDGFQVPLQRLRMKPGMERALALMTKGKAADKGRRFFNLVWLWKSAQRENSPLDYNIGMSLQTTLMAKPFP